MSDPISWGLLASIKKLVKSVKTSVDNIDLSSVTGVVEDIATDLGQDMDELVANVGAEVDEMKEAVENAPAGPFPFVMNKFQVNSVDEGIKITYKANNSASITSGNDKENAVGSIEPRGVMIRYSDDHYPATPTDGLLAIDDTDIVDDVSATGQTKEKTYTLPGLTNNQLYYFSAFPYSYSGVFNTNCGFSGDTSRHRKTCSYTGNKGTLTVTVTQDYNYKTLGEFTATLTPTSGSAKTQTRTGPGQVVFAGLDAGAYTLSFSAETYFTTPASQQITITAGQPNTTSAEYRLSGTIAGFSWAEIKEISDDGRAGELFSVGDIKSVKVTSFWIGIDRTHTTNPEIRDEQEIYVDAVVAAINHYENEDGSHNNIVFCTKKTVVTAEVGYGTCCWVANGGGSTHFSDYMKKESTISKILPEVSGLLKTVKLPTCYYAGNSSGGNLNAVENCKMFPPSFSEVGGVSGNLVGDGTKYPYFSNNENRKMKSVSGYDTAWVTRTTARNWSYSPAFCGVKADGTLENIYDATIGDGSMPVCFCI